MKRIILHIDVNNAFLSWTAIYKLKNGEKIDIIVFTIEWLRERSTDNDLYI